LEEDGNITSIKPGETHTYSCTSEPITQIDIDAREIFNSVHVTVDAPASFIGVVPEVDANVTTQILVDASYTVKKDSNTTPTKVGDTLVYTFEIKNIGNIALSDINIVDNKCDGNISYASGDNNNDMLLDVNETYIYNCISMPITQIEIAKFFYLKINKNKWESINTIRFFRFRNIFLNTQENYCLNILFLRLL